MANIPKRITDLTLVAGTSIASDDSFPFVDASDTTDGTAGTTKRVAGSAFLLQNNGTVTQNTIFSGTVSFLGNNTYVANSLGVGTATVSDKLEVRDGASGATSNSSYNGITVHAAANTGLQLLSPNNSVGVITFGDPEDNDICRIVYRHSTNRLDFETNAALAVTIDSNGNLGVGTATPASKLEVNGTARIDALRLDQTPTAGAVTLTHYVTVDLNGTTYRIPVGTA